jgi:signal transduction histidine kinase
LRRGERIDHFDTVRQRKDGSLLDVSLTVSPVKDAAGRIVGASKVARDVSERRRSEEKYRTLAQTLDAEVRVRTSELEQRNAEVEQQSEQLRDLSRRLLQIQDEERRHIARELHDSAGQTLTALGMNLDRVSQEARKNGLPLGEDVEAIQLLVQRLSQEIRTTSYLLHPPMLDEIGLPEALRWYMQGLTERSGLDVNLDVSEDFGRLPLEMELVMFRLIQECLTNIHRHSGSKSAVIGLAREEESVSLEVQDGGKGISPEKLSQIQAQGSGVGIRGMRERVRQFDGRMNIESNEKGTKISFKFPLKTPTPKRESKIEQLQATG